MNYPELRMRRLRAHDWSRRLVSEHSLSSADLIWPIFLIEGTKRTEAIGTMPGIERRSIDLAVACAREAKS